jgi:sugar lactone lactonase YvrE
MMARRMVLAGALLVCCLEPALVRAADEGPIQVPVDSERWSIAAGRVVEHLGRQALAGSASLGDVALTDGTIEVDVAVTGATSYPGIDFRMQPDGAGESVYLRPHRISRYGDSIQYAPKAGRASSWQLYSGEGYTAGFDIPAGEWFTLKLEVLGGRARAFIGDSDQPALVVEHLQSDHTAGGIALSGPPDGSAFFSNFRYSAEPPTGFGPPAWRDSPPGIIAEWQVSEVVSDEIAEADVLPGSDVLNGLSWQRVESDPSGLVDISRRVPRTGARPDTVLARTTVLSDRQVVRPLDIGYSDHVTVYLNGRPVFRGRSAYRERDPSFLGIVGPYDTVFLPLDEGDNQLVLKVTEAFGGWGLLARWGDASHLDPEFERAWTTPPDFKVPESVAWDPGRQVLYVSNYDGYNPSGAEGAQAISKVALDGRVTEAAWVTGLRNPVGLAVSRDTLWVAERSGLAKIDLATEEVVARFALPAPGFPNDVAVDEQGRVYLSDTRRGVIYRTTDDGLEEWIGGIGQPNGLHVLGGELLIGVNGDHSIRAANLETRALRIVARLGPGTIDGIRSDTLGNILVSHWEGRVLRIAPDGSITKLLDTSIIEEQCADFEYVADRELLVIPTFLGGRVTAIRVRADEPGVADGARSSS